jgi:hypothetical protein
MTNSEFEVQERTIECRLYECAAIFAVTDVSMKHL